VHPILSVDGLTKTFPLRGLSRLGGLPFLRAPRATPGAGAPARLLAVDDVSFAIARGETLGLVGESGSGKSTLGRCIAGLTAPDGGNIYFRDFNLPALPARGPAAREARRALQMVFQDPAGSLNPRLRVRDIVGDPLKVHRIARGRAERHERVAELLRRVGLDAPFLDRYPHELSGGQKQRVGIARALATDPGLIVLDEPTSALDVSVRSKVIALLERLQEASGLAYLFISHDLSTVKYLSHRVAVLYLGQLVELAPAAELFNKPLHPYTQALLSAVPIPEPGLRRERIRLRGETGTPLTGRVGCPLADRCPFVMDRCRSENPVPRPAAPGHTVACHLHA
jgi:oligopeptide/dipeptide ABC transporter ATP-binding protein